MSFGRSLLAAALAASLAACATPGGLEPRAKLAAANDLEAGRSLAGAPVSPATWPRADWWRGFADPQLDALVDEALADGPSLRIARARLDKARALALAAGAAREPH